MSAYLHYPLNLFCVKSLFLFLFSHVQLFTTPCNVACLAFLSMGFSRQEYWSGLPFPSPGDLLNPGIEPKSPAFQVDSLLLSHQGRSSRRYYSLLNTPTLQEVMWMAWTSMQSINWWIIQSIFNFKLYSNKAHGCKVNTWPLEALFPRLITVQLVNCSEDNPIDCLNNWNTRNYIVF